MSERDKIHTGELFLPMDPTVFEEQIVHMDLLWEYNQTKPSQQAERAALLQRMLGDCGEDVYIEAPFYANWGGYHCHFGKGVYANYHLTCVDDTHIYVGDFCQIGPNVVLATAGHPICPELRKRAYQYNAPVRIGGNCWLGAGVIVVPGVTIGNNVVVGAGSVVTHDLPDSVIAVGNPCRILREVNARDWEYYFKERKINPDLL